MVLGGTPPPGSAAYVSKLIRFTCHLMRIKQRTELTASASNIFL